MSKGEQRYNLTIRLYTKYIMNMYNQRTNYLPEVSNAPWDFNDVQMVHCFCFHKFPVRSFITSSIILPSLSLTDQDLPTSRGNPISRGNAWGKIVVATASQGTPKPPTLLKSPQLPQFWANT